MTRMCRGRLFRTLALPALLLVAECGRYEEPPPAVPPLAPVAPLTPVVPADPVTMALVVPGADDALFGPPRPDPSTLEVAWAKELPPLQIECANTRAKASLVLYEPDGTVDPIAIDVFSLIAADANGAYPFQQRLVQLVVKAAHHFDVNSLVVVSGYRKPRRKGMIDHHAKGEAVDFRLPGVDYKKLAAYLRTLPRVGVGVYTDPRTHYVHLDVRDASFHWLDASPPGVIWREARLPDPKQAVRDAEYSSESDLPVE